jgi:maltose-binding protein MalE
MAAALQLYASWHESPPGIAPLQSYDEMHTRFLNGDIGLMIDGEWAIKELERTQKVEWGVVSLPAVSETEETLAAAPLVLGRYWAISPAAATGDRALASTTFVEFMTRPERQLTWTRQFGLLPSRREALDEPFITNDPILRVSARQMQAGQAVPLETNTNLLLDAMREPLRGLLEGELTPEEAAELMQMNAERQ